MLTEECGILIAKENNYTKFLSFEKASTEQAYDFQRWARKQNLNRILTLCFHKWEEKNYFLNLNHNNSCAAIQQTWDLRYTYWHKPKLMNCSTYRENLHTPRSLFCSHQNLWQLRLPWKQPLTNKFPFCLHKIAISNPTGCKALMTRAKLLCQEGSQ